MPALTPFYKVPPESLIVENFDGWAGKGWVEDTDFDESKFNVNGFFADFALGASGPKHDLLIKTLTGLPPNELVRIAIGLDWSLGIGAPGGPGTPIDGLLFGGWINDDFQQLPGPSFFAPGVGLMVWTIRTDESGEVVAQVGAVGIRGSYNIIGSFTSVEVTTVVSDFSDIIIDSATLIESGVQVSITRGSLSFDPGEEWDDYQFPGRVMNTLGARELVRMKPVIKGNLMMTGEREMGLYRPDGTWASHATIDGGRTFTPGALRTALSTGFYMEGVYCVWKRQRGDYIAVEFPAAICGSYGIGSQDGDEGLIPVVIEAVQDPTGATTKTAIPYRIHTLPADTQLEDLT